MEHPEQHMATDNLAVTLHDDDARRVWIQQRPHGFCFRPSEPWPLVARQDARHESFSAVTSIRYCIGVPPTLA